MVGLRCFQLDACTNCVSTIPRFFPAGANHACPVTPTPCYK
jgi:hypothetical protein